MRRLKNKIFVVLLIMTALISGACAKEQDRIVYADDGTPLYEVKNGVIKTLSSGKAHRPEEMPHNEALQYIAEQMGEFQQLQDTLVEIWEKQELNYVLGQYTEDGYISQYADYYFRTPEGCRLATQEQLLVEMGYSEADVTNKYEEILEEYVQQEYITDLYAYYPETGSNIRVTAEGVSKEVTSSWQAIYSLVKALRKDPEEVNRVEYGDLPVEIAGEEYEKGVIKFTLEKDEMVLCREFYVNCENSVLKCITIEYVEGNESERDALLEAFSAL